MSDSSYTYFPANRLTLRPDVAGARYFGISLEKAMLTYFEVEAGASFAEHSHESEQITLVLSGELVFSIAGDDVAVGPLEAIAIPGNVAHAVRCDRATTAVDAWSPPREGLGSDAREPRDAEGV